MTAELSTTVADVLAAHIPVLVHDRASGRVRPAGCVCGAAWPLDHTEHVARLVAEALAPAVDAALREAAAGLIERARHAADLGADDLTVDAYEGAAAYVRSRVGRQS